MPKTDETNPDPYPRVFNHVGVGVSDIERGVDWYRSVLGFVMVQEPFEVKCDGSYGGQIARNIFGEGFQHMKMAHMAAGNGVGIELFQWIDRPHERRNPTLEFWKNGFFHIGITDPDVEGLVKRICSSGGKQLSDIWLISQQRQDYRLCYCEDPFGNIVEIYSHGYERVYGGVNAG